MNFEVCKKCIGEYPLEVVLECYEKDGDCGHIGIKTAILGIFDTDIQFWISKCFLFLKVTRSNFYLGKKCNGVCSTNCYQLKSGTERSFFDSISEFASFPAFMADASVGDYSAYKCYCPYLFEHQLYDWNVKE